MSDMVKRRQSLKVKVGSVEVGGGAPISVQSMIKKDPRDLKGILDQVHSLEEVGCEILRLAVPDEEAACSLKAIKAQARVPLEADIHFDHRLALLALESGVDAIRLNPGNITSRAKIQEVAMACKERRVPLRIGINAGSLEKAFEVHEKGPERSLLLARAMVSSARKNIKLLEDMDFTQIMVSLKASDLRATIVAHQLLAEECDYPFHIGITEAGPLLSGTVKSALGIGILLYLGLGDTLRVSLTAPPEEEVRVGFEILKALGLREKGGQLISCPTCGRCEIDVARVAQEVERRIWHLPFPLKVAVMGCSVNGPGEAREADLGLAGGKGFALLFRKGEVIGKVTEDQLVESLVKLAQEMSEQKRE